MCITEAQCQLKILKDHSGDSALLFSKLASEAALSY